MSGNVKLTTDPSTRRDYDGYGLVEVTGSNPANLAFAQSFFQNDGGAFRVFPTRTYLPQVTSSFTSFNLPDTLMAGGGPGSFTFCPGVGSPQQSTCTNPTQATPPFNNRLRYTAGPNQFGGTFRILQQNLSASVTFRIATNPSVFSHQKGDTVARNWPGGAPWGSTQFIQRPPGLLTSGAILGPNGSIQTPGVVIGTATGTPAASLNTGFPLTTGMIVRSDTNAIPETVTLTGSDMRTPLGSGQIVLVGSGVAHSSNGTDFGREMILTLVPEPAATVMFAVGVIGLAGLYSQRRRLF